MTKSDWGTIEWLKSGFSERRMENMSNDTTQDSDLLERFQVFLADRMNSFYLSVRDAFARLLKTEFPTNIKGLHIEVFIDDPAFSFRLFSQGQDDVWTDDCEQIKALNDTIGRIWPIVTQDELDQYIIWEDDPKWGRQVALEQPLDTLNISGIVFPWLRKIVSEAKGDCSLPITIGVHDMGSPEEL
ncbi:hypothetical protein ACRQ1B_22790 [Rhizobium panacihumi]|uniref:hypothetical protein n=1 Tax=Rhizobium panacihumi TaxID=2008450 RepID=UPI003D794F8E